MLKSQGSYLHLEYILLAIRLEFQHSPSIKVKEISLIMEFSSSSLPTIRTNCCMCGSTDLSFYQRVRDVPVFMGVTTQERSLDRILDQEWQICGDCGLLQLRDLLPLDLLYSEGHHHEVVGETWFSHHMEFAEFISKSSGKKVLEVGSAHGVLAKNLLNTCKFDSYTIVEPSPGTYPETCLVVRDYIENQSELISAQDSIVHSHLIEHLYEPAKFIKNLSDNLKTGSKMYISFPNLEEMLQNNGSNALNFEHTYFLTPDQLEPLLNAHSFALVRSKEFRSHSFFWELEKISNPIMAKLPDMRSKVLHFDAYWNEITDFVQRSNRLLRVDPVPTYIFGAHIFSQALISLGLDLSSIVGILDNSTFKQGKRLYGTGFSVMSPFELQNVGQVRVVLKASTYQDEIREQILGINPLTQVIE